MLTELRIENFAIIEQLDVALTSGLVAFTGETGAGKSIIIDAVETLLGGRADPDMVRAGAERANVEAVFRIPEFFRAPVTAILEREQLLDEPDFLTLGREIRLNGRNVARANGRTVNAALLRELGEYLIDVHGQSEHLSLLRVNQHLGLLDRYAISETGSLHQELIQAYRDVYEKLQAATAELERIRQAERDSARRAEMLTFQANEIEAARLQPGEEERLLEERNRLANAEGLSSAIQAALVTLDEGTPESPSATDLLGQAAHALAGLARLDSSKTDLSEQAQVLLENISDLAHSLRQYQEAVEFNPKRLDEVEERLALIQNLKRKYGGSLEAVLEHAGQARKQLEEITSAAERLQALESEQASLLAQLGERGTKLGQARRSAAEKLSKAIENELNDLQMSGARFEVSFKEQPDPQGAPLSGGRQVSYTANGLEQIEFLIAPNLGEGFKPLVKIASGGETSRLMLALKNVLAKADPVPTLIFDEIDQGIGGRVGAVVGQKLWKLGRQHQVFCITHLPQLAAYGEQHLHVEKVIQEGRTTTRVRKLEGQERLVELANMLGSLSEGTLQSAFELLQAAQKDEGVAANSAVP